jgi:pyruvate dehydrogenase E2 component (dihydrolipoamide acetyltransferase)
MPELLLVPEVAAGATEVVLSEWLVADGASFRAGDPIAVIETDKAIVEVEAEAGATLLKALVNSGTTVGVGSPMALLGAPEDVGGDVDAMLNGLGIGGVSEVVVSTSLDRRASPAGEPVATPMPTPARTFISPIARKLLRDAGVGVNGITGTGPNGRIVRRDVEAALAKMPASTPERVGASGISTISQPGSSRPESDGPWTDLPHTRLRQAVATRLSDSKASVPHFYLKRTARLGALLALRMQLNEASPTRLSVNDFLIRAVAVAHTKVPDANVIWTEDALRRFEHVDIAVAIASAKGLVTPVLRRVEASSLSAISEQVKTFAEQADAGRLQQRDLEGGSISISNLGMYGVDEFAAIINPPHSAILAVGAARATAVIEKGKPRAATTVDLVVSVDHRAIDGALAAQWMAALVDALEDPLQLVV